MAQPSLEELKPEIDKHLQYLKNKLKFAKNDKTFDALCRLDDIRSQVADPEAFASYVKRQGFCKTSLYLWEQLSKYCTKESDQGQRNLLALLGVTGNMADESRVFGDEMVALGIVEILLKVIGDIKLDNDWLGSPVLSILHNCIRLSDSNRTAYRDANAIGVLKPLLESGNGQLQMKALIVLAYVVNENEREILATSKSGLKLLLALLKGCVASSNHKAADIVDCVFSAFEILAAINQLAINDSSKAEVEKQGAIPDIIRMLEEDFSADEHLVAVEALWNLSFMESIRVSELLQSAIPTLEKLGNSSNRVVQRACASALWQIKDRTSETNQPPCAEKAPPTYQESLDDPVYTVSSEPLAAAAAKIMLSYQWDHQKCVLKIRDKLERAGCKVWMDVSDIEGDILGAMAKAVEESDVILMCMSERYRDSNSCRREATYACKLEKKIIPLLMEVGYAPDGWLGLLQGMDLYYACYSDKELDRTMLALRKVISDRTPATSEDAVDGPITAIKQTTSGTLPPTAADWPAQDSSTSGTASSAAADQSVQGSSISGTASSAAADQSVQGSSTSGTASSAAADWSAQDVQEWLREKNLTCPALDDFDGGGLQELHTHLPPFTRLFTISFTII